MINDNGFLILISFLWYIWILLFFLKIRYKVLEGNIYKKNKQFKLG